MRHAETVPSARTKGQRQHVEAVKREAWRRAHAARRARQQQRQADADAGSWWTQFGQDRAGFMAEVIRRDRVRQQQASRHQYGRME